MLLELWHSRKFVVNRRIPEIQKVNANLTANSEVLLQFTMPARKDKTVLSVSYQAVWIESRYRLAVWTVKREITVVAWRLVKTFRFSHMQQSTACLHFAWRTTSLRVGGLAARRSCLPGMRHGGGRQAGATVFSWLVSRCKLSRPDKCVLRRSASGGRTAPPQTLGRRPEYLSGDRADSIHTATADAAIESCLCRVWRGGAN